MRAISPQAEVHNQAMEQVAKDHRLELHNRPFDHPIRGMMPGISWVTGHVDGLAVWLGHAGSRDKSGQRYEGQRYQSKQLNATHVVCLTRRVADSTAPSPMPRAAGIGG